MKILFVNSTKFTLSGFVSIGFLFLVSCNKTEDYEKLDLLLGKDWNLESRKSNGVEIIDSCELDDVLHFESSSEFSYNTGASICSQEVLTQTPSSWMLNEDNTILHLKYKFKGNNSRGSMVEYWEIVELSETALIIQDATAADSDLVPEVRTYK